jgi:hypothetical protein
MVMVRMTVLSVKPHEFNISDARKMSKWLAGAAFPCLKKNLRPGNRDWHLIV